MALQLPSFPALVFWDFDGVVKDSVDVKTKAFARLFEPYGPQTVERVRAHHGANGGMSRFEKFPIYLRWAGVEPTAERVEACCREFAELVVTSVIEAPWVSGAEELLRGNPFGQAFVLVTATPQEEIEQILKALSLDGCFTEVCGAPTPKQDAIRAVLAQRRLDPAQSLFIGDAQADLAAAQANRVPFLLRCHESNAAISAHYAGNFVEDITELCSELARLAR